MKEGAAPIWLLRDEFDNRLKEVGENHLIEFVEFTMAKMKSGASFSLEEIKELKYYGDRLSKSENLKIVECGNILKNFSDYTIPVHMDENGGIQNGVERTPLSKRYFCGHSRESSMAVLFTYER